MRRVLPAVAAALVVAGCGGDDKPAATPTQTPAAASGPAAAGLTPADVPAHCRRHVPEAAKGAPSTLLNPPARVAVQPGAKADGGITRVSGYVGMDPGPFLAAWRSRPDVTVLDGENEGFDAEVQVQGPGTQVFWKLKKVCDGGSTFTAIVTTG